MAKSLYDGRLQRHRPLFIYYAGSHSPSCTCRVSSLSQGWKVTFPPPSFSRLISRGGNKFNMCRGRRGNRGGGGGGLHSLDMGNFIALELYVSLKLHTARFLGFIDDRAMQRTELPHTSEMIRA